MHNAATRLVAGPVIVPALDLAARIATMRAAAGSNDAVLWAERLLAAARPASNDAARFMAGLKG